MYCSNCGNPHGDKDNFCKKCGTAIPKIDLPDTQTSRKVWNTLLLLGTVGVLVVFIILVKSIAKQDTYEINNLDEVADNILDKEDFIDSNEMGNTSINIYLNDGRYVSKDGWTYYVLGYDIKKVNAAGVVIDVYHENRELHGGLNIVGEWIYYRYDGGIAKVKTDGTEREIVIPHDNSSYVRSQILVKGNMIYYLASDKVSSSRSNYILHLYNIKTGENINLYNFGEKTDAGMLGIYGDILYVIDRNDSTYYVAPINLDEYHNTGNAIFYASSGQQILCMAENMLLIKENEDLVALDVTDGKKEMLRYSGALGIASSTPSFYSTHDMYYVFGYFEDGNLCTMEELEWGHCNNYNLCYATSYNLSNYADGQTANWNSIMQPVINEESIYSIYISDGFIYYYTFNWENVYRVGIDGSGWMQL